jgi:hypothetical protein
MAVWIFLLCVGSYSAMADTAPEIAKKAFGSTLVVTTEDKKGHPLKLGSAFFVRDGEIVTNCHVVEGAMRVKAKLVDAETEFVILEVAGVDKEHDLAILRVSGPKTPFLPIGDSDAAQVGETVYAVGCPQGLEGTFSQGIISGKRSMDNRKLLQITAPISAGSSGGPVMNEKGEVIGIATSSFGNSQNLNLAVPSNDLKALLSKIADNQKAQLRPATAAAPVPRGQYPWRLHITATLFWIGEQPSENNPVPNTRSSWDAQWMANYGGYDDPNPANRIADFVTGEFRPKAFVPKLNPFYVALPYNDVSSSNQHKAEAVRVIPWFARLRPDPGETVCKGRWVQIYNGRSSCYAQWEDCGPWVTDDWEYVFGNGNKPPKNKDNSGAGISMSPAIRDYLTLPSGKKVHWRFVEAAEVPYGPWKKYGPQPPTRSAPPNPGQRPPDNADLATQQRYMEYLRKLRDEEHLKRPLTPPKK